jgi:hypothetical protein
VVDEAAIKRIADELLDPYGYEDELTREHRQQHLLSIMPPGVSKEMAPALEAALTRVLAPLPDDALWAISRPDPGVYVLTDDELFLFSIGGDHKTVRTSSREIGGNVSLWSMESEEIDDPVESVTRHVWTFWYGDSAADEPEMLRRVEGREFHRPATAENWPDRGEQLACALAARSAAPSGGEVPITAIEQDLLAQARWYRWREHGDEELQQLVKEAIAHHGLTPERISALTGVPTAKVNELNDAPDV